MTEPPKHRAFVAAGMPELDTDGKPVSYFEFWPTWVMYLPVVIQWMLLALRYRSLTLPLIANPAIPLSGMVGVPKTAVFKQAGPEAKQWILPWVEYEAGEDDLTGQLQRVGSTLSRAGLSLPVVAKPNLGCRGAGVRLLRSEADLRNYLENFPPGATIQFQRLAEWEAEAGVFYVRHPDREGGEITSLTLKYMPYVVGDGVSTLGQLVNNDSRAGRLSHLYQARHAADWGRVLAADEAYRLVFSASHCRGAVFRDGSEYITDRLTKSLDRIFNDIPGFYYGRLDIKFRDLESLTNGKDFAIIEINGASSESINIWDRRTGLLEAITTLLRQYRTLFRLGHANRRRGHQPPPMRALWDAWRQESRLVARYPAND